MTDRKDGGPAFPLNVSDSVMDHQYQSGMSLRDWFAGQALAGQLAFSPDDSFDKIHQPDEVCSFAYRIADGMIAERNKRDRDQ